MLSVDFQRVKGVTSHEAEMRRQAQALIDNGWRPDAREGRAVRTGDTPAGFIAPDVWKMLVAMAGKAIDQTWA